MPSFSSLGLQNLQLNEDKENGYSINVNFDEGTISIYPDYRRWQMSDVPPPISIGSLPADAEIIAISNAFIKEHGVDTKIYGAPVIENKTYSSMGEDGKEQQMAMDSLTVTYPLVLDGTEVYDQSGFKFGLQITVDVRQKKVTGVNNLTAQIYESSNYALETDAKKVLNTATSGPQYDVMPLTAAEDNSSQVKPKITTVGLQTPKRVLMHYVTYEKDQTIELFVPALLFPFESKKGTPEYQKIL